MHLENLCEKKNAQIRGKKAPNTTLQKLWQKKKLHNFEPKKKTKEKTPNTDLQKVRKEKRIAQNPAKNKKKKREGEKKLTAPYKN